VPPAIHIGIPFARSVNPVTGTNWQGTGVVPDIPASSEEAFTVAYRAALGHVLAEGDVPPPLGHEKEDALAALDLPK
jgi:hypothetical protein